MTFLTILSTKVLYLIAYITAAAPKPSAQEVQAVQVKCDWVPNDLKKGLEDIAGNFAGLTLLVASILTTVVLFVLIVLFASKWRNTLLLFLAGAVIVGTLAGSGINLVASKC